MNSAQEATNYSSRKGVPQKRGSRKHYAGIKAEDAESEFLKGLKADIDRGFEYFVRSVPGRSKAMKNFG